MKRLVIIFAVLLIAGCITRYVVTETASGSAEDPTITRTTEGYTSNPWSDAPVPKSQGKMRARSGSVTSGETDWFDPVVTGSGLHPLYIIGGLTILAGAAIAIFLKDWVNGGLVCLIGAALIAYVFLIETYPWVILIVFLIAAGAGAWLVYQMYTKHRGLNTVSKTVSAINKFKENEPAAWRKLKPFLSSVHDGAVEKQITRTRRKLATRKRHVFAASAETSKKVTKKSVKKKSTKKVTKKAAKKKPTKKPKSKP